ncbi:MAG: acylphosphatase [Nitrospirae bacterium]|nr:acylphosphatase [Nitrospirota bacterium]
MTRAHVVIDGRVQGVGFRYFTRDVARRQKLHGWVKNRSDGCVEAVLEGSKRDVSIAVASCYKGPPGSLVTNVKLDWELYTGEFQTFAITF